MTGPDLFAVLEQLRTPQVVAIAAVLLAAEWWSALWSYSRPRRVPSVSRAHVAYDPNERD